MKNTITRAELRKAVEVGIERAKLRQPSLTDAQATILRHVAATTTRVTRGDFDFQGCGCPLTQAGLAYLDSDEEFQLSDEGNGFWQAFDEATSFTHANCSTMEVVG